LNLITSTPALTPATANKYIDNLGLQDNDFKNRPEMSYFAKGTFGGQKKIKESLIRQPVREILDLFYEPK